MKFLRYSFSLLLLLGLGSCKKYLDLKSSNALVVPSTLSDYQALLDDNATMNTAKSASFGESSTDDYFWLDSRLATAPLRTIGMYTWKPVDYNYPNDFSTCYLPVYNANLCLEGLEKIPVTSQNQAQWNNVKGSAHFFRAFYFSQLTFNYAKAFDSASASTDLGIMLRLKSDFNDAPGRASVQASYNQILSDAKLAIDFLPNIPIHPMRPSKAACYGLLARVYLMMRVYDSAFKYSDLALGINSSLIDYNGGTGINGSVSAATPFTAFHPEVIFQSTMNINQLLHHPSGGGLMDTVLYATYNNNDLRKTAFFGASSGYFRFKGNYAADALNLFAGLATDEMYLIRAECYARSGNTTASMGDLNALMKKRWKNTVVYPTVTASTPAAALSIVLTERRKELLLRSLRWIDIKRQNKEGANITLKHVMAGQTYTLAPNANYYALPLPLDMLNISGVQQNPF